MRLLDFGSANRCRAVFALDFDELGRGPEGSMVCDHIDATILAVRGHTRLVPDCTKKVRRKFLEL